MHNYKPSNEARFKDVSMTYDSRKYRSYFVPRVTLRIYQSGDCFLWIANSCLLISRREAYELLTENQGEWLRSPCTRRA